MYKGLTCLLSPTQPLTLLTNLADLMAPNTHSTTPVNVLLMIALFSMNDNEKYIFFFLIDGLWLFGFYWVLK